MEVSRQRQWQQFLFRFSRVTTSQNIWQETDTEFHKVNNCHLESICQWPLCSILISGKDIILILLLRTRRGEHFQMTFNCLSDKIGIIFGKVQFGKMAKISTCDTIAQKVCMKVYIIVKRTHAFFNRCAQHPIQMSAHWLNLDWVPFEVKDAIITTLNEQFGKRELVNGGNPSMFICLWLHQILIKIHIFFKKNMPG